MQEEKQHGKKKWLRVVLSLLLAIALVCVAIPIESGLAEETKTSAEEATEPDTGTESESEEIENAESAAEGETLEGTEEPAEPVTYENSISGKLWLDMQNDADSSTDSGNGVYDTGEDGVPGYTVGLYKANDTKNEVQVTTTDDTGKYEFTNLEPDSYIVGVAQATMDGTEYLLPSFELDGTEGDNRFAAAYDEEADPYLFAYTAPVTVEADTVETDLDCGLRTPIGIQPMANTTYKINITSQTTYNDSVTAAGGSIPGVSYSGGVLTFNNTVDSSDTYVLTGTAGRVVVNSGSAVTANITLGDAGTKEGLNISALVSPFQIQRQSNSNVNLTLGADTTNELECLGTSGSSNAIQAGLYVPINTTLTIGGTGKLEATGGRNSAGIGGTGMAIGGGLSSANGSGNITINSGTITANAVDGAGIGGGYQGNGGVTTISGGTVTATSNQGAGIGGGYHADGGTININGGAVNATTTEDSANYSGAGIGGGVFGDGGTTTISGTANVTATTTGTGAGIGGGQALNSSTGGKGGIITISGGRVNARNDTQKSAGGAGIGGGREGEGGTISISGGIVKATGGGTSFGGAGIGGGNFNNGGTITISGGTVTTEGGMMAAGIGGGGSKDYFGNGGGGGNGGTIEISGGVVTAKGNQGGAGIGGGMGSTPSSGGGTIKLTGGTISAYASPAVHPAFTGYVSGAGIGGGFDSKPALSLEIDAATEVYAYSCNSRSPALWANTITGTGYYVNAYFGDGPLSDTDDYTLRVHSGNYAGTYTNSIPLPAPSACFAYTTGGSSKIYHTRAIHQASGKDHGHVVEYDSEDPNVLLSVNGGQALGATDLYKVKLSPLPFLGDISHANVVQTTADLISEDHSFSLGTNNYGYFDYDLDGSFATGNYTRVPWSSTTANPYTEHLTGLTPNTLYSYRSYLENEYGNTTSATKQFLTLPRFSWSASGTTFTDSIVSGSITPSANNNPIKEVTVTIASDSNFTSNVQTHYLTLGGPVDGYTNTSFTANFGQLAAGKYYVSVSVSNLTGSLGGTRKEYSDFVVAAGYAITETYVDLSSGTRIDSAGLPDTMVYAANSYTPQGTPPASHTVSGNTYTYLGYYLGTYNPGDPITSGTPSGVTVSGPFTVSYIYEVLVDVSISKTVTGAYGDPNKAFEITVTLEDSVGTPVSGTYTCAGTLTSIHFTSGQAILNLKHGETITIKDIPKGYTYRVQETDASVTGGTYGVTYTGTGTVTGSGSSADISETLGAAAATVTITNDRSTVPTSGLTGTNYQLAAVGAGALSVLAAAVILLWKYRRKKKCI